MTESEKERLAHLEEEGEIAADYLEELLDIADVDGDIEIDVENGRASVEIVAEDPDALARLVGEDGEVLDALQELTRLAVQSETGKLWPMIQRGWPVSSVTRARCLMPFRSSPVWPFSQKRANAPA